MPKTKYEKTNVLVPFEYIEVDHLFFWNNEYWTKSDDLIAIAVDNNKRTQSEIQFMEAYQTRRFNKTFHSDTLVNATKAIKQYH